MRQPLVSCLLFPGLCLAAGFPARAQSLLVVNQGDTSLSIVDPASAKQVAVIAEGTPTMHGHEVATSPDGRTAYVPIYGNVGVGKPGLDGHEMLIIDLPSRHYLVFRQVLHGGALHPQMQRAAREIWGERLPNSGHRLAQTPDLEVYPPDFGPNRAGAWVEWWVPVEG